MPPEANQDQIDFFEREREESIKRQVLFQYSNVLRDASLQYSSLMY